MVKGRFECTFKGEKKIQNIARPFVLHFFLEPESDQWGVSLFRIQIKD